MKVPGVLGTNVLCQLPDWRLMVERNQIVTNSQQCDSTNITSLFAHVIGAEDVLVPA